MSGPIQPSVVACSQGVRAAPFAKGVDLGAHKNGNELFVTLKAEQPWSGRLVFDGPRTRHAAGTLDWARLNEMPQWFVVQPERRYWVSLDESAPRVMSGAELTTGLALDAAPQKVIRIRVRDRATSEGSSAR